MNGRSEWDDLLSDIDLDTSSVESLCQSFYKDSLAVPVDQAWYPEPSLCNQVVAKIDESEEMATYKKYRAKVNQLECALSYILWLADTELDNSENKPLIPALTHPVYYHTFQGLHNSIHGIIERAFVLGMMHANEKLGPVNDGN